MKKKKEEGGSEKGREQAFTKQTQYSYSSQKPKKSADTHKLMSRIPTKGTILPEELAHSVELPVLASQSTFYSRHNTTFHPQKHRQNMECKTCPSPTLND